MRDGKGSLPVTIERATGLELEEDLRQLLARISELTGRLSGLDQDAPGDEAEEALELARYLVQARRRRDMHLAGFDLSEVQWCLLVELFVAAGEGKPLSIKAACFGTAAPKTTALRHLDGLLAAGLARRLGHPSDHRSAHVELTQRGRALLAGYFEGEVLRQRIARRALPLSWPEPKALSELGSGGKTSQ